MASDDFLRDAQEFLNAMRDMHVKAAALLSTDRALHREGGYPKGRGRAPRLLGAHISVLRRRLAFSIAEMERALDERRL